MNKKTLFDKIWNSHVIEKIEGGPSVVYIDRHLIHEVTSPQAFGGLDSRGLKVFRPKQTFATPDHNVPTKATVEVRARTSYGKILIHRANQTTQTGNK